MTSYTGLRTTLIVFVVSFVVVACGGRSYTAQRVTTASDYARVIERAQKKHRYIMMQSGINFYTVKSVDIDKARQHMTVTLDKLDSTKFLNTAAFESAGYKPANGASAAPRQVHVYLNDSTSYTYDEPHTIPVAKVGRIDVVE